MQTVKYKNKIMCIQALVNRGYISNIKIWHLSYQNYSRKTCMKFLSQTEFFLGVLIYCNLRFCSSKLTLRKPIPQIIEKMQSLYMFQHQPQIHGGSPGDRAVH